MTAVAKNGSVTFGVAVGTAVSKYRLVTMDANGDISHASATDDVCGVCDNDVPSAAADRTRGDTATVCPLNHNGALRFTASAAISVGDQLEKAADGKVATVSAGEALSYVCITDNIAADGDVLEAVPFR